MLDLCYVHARSDCVKWRAAFEKWLEQTNFFFFFLGDWGGEQQPQNLTDFMSWGKTSPPLARHPKVVGRCGSCSSRSRFMKTKMHLAELDWKEQTEECVVVCFLLRLLAVQNSICIFSHVLLAVWIWSLKSKTIVVHENLNFPNAWEKLWMGLEISYQLNSDSRGWGSNMSFPLSSQKSPCDGSQKIWS